MIVCVRPTCAPAPGWDDPLYRHFTLILAISLEMRYPRTYLEQPLSGRFSTSLIAMILYERGLNLMADSYVSENKPDPNSSMRLEGGLDLPEPQKTFLLEEQKQRRSEIDTLIARMDRDQRYGLIITGVMWSWLLTDKIIILNNDKIVRWQAVWVVAFIPSLITLLFLFRWWRTDKAVRGIADYTRQLEKLFGLPRLPAELGIFGWETWLMNTRSKKKHNIADDFRGEHKVDLRLIGLLWWLSLFFANVSICLLFALYR
jgi:hypothetical protein